MTSDDDDPPELAAMALAGFWRRWLAFLIDTLLLGVVGFVLGLVLYDPLAALGGAGRIVGFAIALAYFGLLNSAVGGGQTVGKRVLGIRVTDAVGRPIPPARSALRYAILALPYFLNGSTSLPAGAGRWASVPATLLVFGLGGAIAYLFAFNRVTRQSLHDLATGTWVVKAGAAAPPASLRVWGGHGVVLAVWGGLVLLLALLGARGPQAGGLVSEMLALQERLQSSDAIRGATVTVGTNWGTNSETHYVATSAIWRTRPVSMEAAATEVAAIVLREYPAIDQMDQLAITVSYGFDIGIAEGWRSASESLPPAEWRERIGAAGP